MMLHFVYSYVDRNDSSSILHTCHLFPTALPPCCRSALLSLFSSCLCVTPPCNQLVQRCQDKAQPIANNAPGEVLSYHRSTIYTGIISTRQYTPRMTTIILLILLRSIILLIDWKQIIADTKRNVISYHDTPLSTTHYYSTTGG